MSESRANHHHNPFEPKEAHRAEVMTLHFCLFFAKICSSCIFTPISVLSLLIVLLKVSLGLPALLLPVGAHLKIWCGILSSLHVQILEENRGNFPPQQREREAVVAQTVTRCILTGQIKNESRPVTSFRASSGSR